MYSATIGHYRFATTHGQLLFHGGRASDVSMQQELWVTDFSAASPVQRRIAGVNPATESNVRKFRSGACSTARFATIGGLATLPNGDLVVLDVVAKNLTRVSAPTSASCAVTVLAGAATDDDNLDMTTGKPSRSGDIDGAGAAARFAFTNPLYARVAADPSGNVYVFDDGNIKFKKIASDASRTVSTLATLPQATLVVFSLSWAGGRLRTFFDGKLQTLDGTSGALSTVTLPLLANHDGSNLPQITGMWDDGTGNGLVFISRGTVFWMPANDPSGVRHIAGSGGSGTSYPAGHTPDTPKAPLQLVILRGLRDLVLSTPGALLVRGEVTGVNGSYELYRITCP